jgi:hypothetical protein
MGSASEGMSSHRQNDPAQEADTLEPKGTGYGAGSRKSDRSALPLNPVESTVLRMRPMGTGNGVTPSVLSGTIRSRCQPYGVRGGIPQEAKAGGNTPDMLT